MMQLLLHLSVVAQNLEKALAVELAVDLAVYGHDRGKAATAETGDGFNREDASSVVCPSEIPSADESQS